MQARESITLLGSAAAWPHEPRAQRAERVRRIGVLLGDVANDPEGQARIAAFLLQKLGWSIDFMRVASNIVGQVAQLVALGKWSPPPAGCVMRGVDFYPWKHLFGILIARATIFERFHGYVPRLASPISFNEHIFARKFFAPLPIPSLADKLAAKDHVKARLRDRILPAVTWVGDDIDGLVAAKPPAGRYVLKANHGLGNAILFLDLPGDLSAKRDEIEQRATTWLTTRFGYLGGEWQYCIFKPKLFLEEFIDFKGVRTPDDYKFYCFRSKVCLIELNVDRFTRLRSAFYTPDWKHIPVAYRHAPIQRPRPRNLEDMIRVAEAIAEGMEYARVDLYSDRKSRIYFGEITFAPGNAHLRFSDFKFDLWLGTFFGNDPHEPFA